MENYLDKIRNLTPLQNYNKRKITNNFRVLNETKQLSVAKSHLTKEEIKEYTILYIMFNYPEIILPRVEIFKDIKFSAENINKLKSELTGFISQGEVNEKNVLNLKKKYENLIIQINQNSVIKNIFAKKDENQKIELLNEVLKELNDIKFSKKIEDLENKLIKEFDEKSYSDLMQLKKQINKE